MDQPAEDFSEFEATAHAALMRQQRIAVLWTKPLLADDEVPAAVGLAPSSWHAIKARGEGPVMFSIGRRKFSLTDDVRAWLNGLRAKVQKS